MGLYGKRWGNFCWNHTPVVEEVICAATYLGQSKPTRVAFALRLS